MRTTHVLRKKHHHHKPAPQRMFTASPVCTTKLTLLKSLHYLTQRRLTHLPPQAAVTPHHHPPSPNLAK
jgi:hypothetical protein